MTNLRHLRLREFRKLPYETLFLVHGFVFLCFE